MFDEASESQESGDFGDVSSESQDLRDFEDSISDMFDEKTNPNYQRDKKRVFKWLNVLNIESSYSYRGSDIMYPACQNDLGGDCYGETHDDRVGTKQRRTCACKFVYCQSCYYLGCPRCSMLLFKGLDLQHTMVDDFSFKNGYTTGTSSFWQKKRYLNVLKMAPCVDFWLNLHQRKHDSSQV